MIPSVLQCCLVGLVMGGLQQKTNTDDNVTSV